MQGSQSQRPVQTTAPAQRPGPVPLDLKDLQRVAGGLPRGGWLASEPVETSQLPRGGW